nr:MAG TPA: hypothetical protein [Caudoviricetes sp.]
MLRYNNFLCNINNKILEFPTKILKKQEGYWIWIF